MKWWCGYETKKCLCQYFHKQFKSLTSLINISNLKYEFDEVVVVLQMADVTQRTIPRQMFSGIREQISPTILAVATILVILSVVLLTTVELLRRRSERMRGITPG